MAQIERKPLQPSPGDDPVGAEPQELVDHTGGLRPVSHGNSHLFHLGRLCSRPQHHAALNSDPNQG